MPPAFMTLRIGRRLIPLPFVLLWPLLPLLLILGAVILPFVPIRGTTAWARMQLPFALFLALCALRGLLVDIQSANGDNVHIRCW
jgi:hypothetical protein